MRPREPLVFFVDRCLGSKKIARALRAAGALVKVHDDHFPPDTPDEMWLPVVGSRGWVILTKDGQIKKRPNEFVALFDADTAVFVLAAGHMTGAAMGSLFVGVLPAMRAMVSALETPFVARILESGSVVLFLDSLGVTATRATLKG